MMGLLSNFSAKGRLALTDAMWRLMRDGTEATGWVELTGWDAEMGDPEQEDYPGQRVPWLVFERPDTPGARIGVGIYAVVTGEGMFSDMPPRGVRARVGYSIDAGQTTIHEYVTSLWDAYSDREAAQKEVAYFAEQMATNDDGDLAERWGSIFGWDGQPWSAA